MEFAFAGLSWPKSSWNSPIPGLGPVGWRSKAILADESSNTLIRKELEMRASFFAIVWGLVAVASAAAQFGPAVPNGGDPNVEQGQVQGQEGAASASPNVMFAVIDADGDGVITKAELRKAVAALRSLDSDGDGNITLAEVSAASGAAPAGATTVDQLFAEHDKNNDGKLDANEVPQHMLPMLQGADRNQDGSIDRDELAAAMQNRQLRSGAGAFPAGPNGPGADPRTGQVLRRYDLNNDGRLSPHELPPQMRRMFQPTDDRNGDGHLDPGELQAVMARMGGAVRAPAAGVEPDARPFQNPNRRGRVAGEDQN
jgi:Ca2+-binding EF-hand superfamily protein